MEPNQRGWGRFHDRSRRENWEERKGREEGEPEPSGKEMQKHEKIDYWKLAISPFATDIR